MIIDEPDFHTYGKSKVSYYTEHIIWGVTEAIQLAEKYVKVNMAYFNNEIIIYFLKELPNKGIPVELIISNSSNNRKKYGVYNELLEKGVKIYEFGDDDWTKGIMHRKSVVIDGKFVLSGSYNWTDHADRNTEELYIIEDDKVVEKVEEEFDKLKLQCQCLEYQKPILGANTACTKSRQTEIINWWENLSDNWKELFREKFKLDDRPKIADLIRLINIKSLSISYSEIENLIPLTIFQELTSITLYSCEKINDLEPIKDLTKLTYLDIAACSVSDLSPLRNLKGIEELNISNTLVENIAPLVDLKLKRLYMFNINFPFFGLRQKFFRLNPDCKVNEY